jgi:hypothetical protein
MADARPFLIVVVRRTDQTVAPGGFNYCEVLFQHHFSGTLILTDLVVNIEPARPSALGRKVHGYARSSRYGADLHACRNARVSAMAVVRELRLRKAPKLIQLAPGVNTICRFTICSSHAGGIETEGRTSIPVTNYTAWGAAL